MDGTNLAKKWQSSNPEYVDVSIAFVVMLIHKDFMMFNMLNF